MNRRGFIRGMLATVALAAVPFKWTYKKAAKVFTSAKARVFIDGKEVAYITNIEIYDKKLGEDVDLKPLEKLGTLEVRLVQSKPMSGKSLSRKDEA